MNYKQIKQEIVEASKKHPLYKILEQHNGKVVIGKGSKTPTWLLIGEALVFSEIIQGQPFVGKSGKLLDKWLNAENITNYAVINAMPLIPLTDDGKIRAPSDEEIAYFRPYVLNLIEALKPEYIVCIGKTAAKCLEVSFKHCSWQDYKGCKLGFQFHPFHYMGLGKDGLEDFKKLVEQTRMPADFETELSFSGVQTEKAVDDFLSKIKAKKLSDTEFEYQDKKWFIDFHQWEHSDDVIVKQEIVKNYDFFLLVKAGSNRIRFPGFTNREQLLSTPARDIYRNGTSCHLVLDVNLKKLDYFKLEKPKILRQKFVINQQSAENLGATEMINGYLAGLHHFCKQAKIFFKDINQRDEGVLGDKKFKIYVRDYKMDEDMLIYEDYFQAHPEIDLYILLKIKGGNYNYIGYIPKSIVSETRVVQMIGQDSDKESKPLRRIFAEQYKPLSDFIKIYEIEQKEEEIIKPESYVVLHNHSEFSISDGFGKIGYMCDVLKKKGFSAAALTDHGSLAGALEFQRAMLERGLKPIIGEEIYLKIEGIEQRFHLTLLVKNQKGWENLLKLQNLAVRKNFYYKPIVLLEELFKHSEGLICLSGCSSSPFIFFSKNGHTADAFVLMDKFKNVFGDDFYVELMLHNLEGYQEASRKLFEYGLIIGLKAVITPDSHYPQKADKKYHEAIKAIGMKKLYGAAGFGDDIFYLLSSDDIKSLISGRQELQWLSPHYEAMLKNTLEIGEKVDFKILPPKELDTLPKFDIEEQPEYKEMLIEQGLSVISRDSFLLSLANKGLERLGFHANQVYVDRLALELPRIIEKGYTNYFLILWDIMKFCDKNEIMHGACRGSAGASLVSYCLGITGIDPIEHDLLFDRFISSIRKDFVDIDSDFADDRRSEVFDYAIKKYGSEHYAKVITYSRFHPKGVLKDVGRIFKLPFTEVSRLAGMVIERSGGDARNSFSLQDTFEEFAEAKVFKEKHPEAADVAMKLEGHLRHRAVHAAAMILTERPISNHVPITKVGDEIVTEWEKQLCEDMHLIKYDILGLGTLSIISDAVKIAECVLPNKFDDERVYKEIFQSGDTTAIFQFSTVGLTKLAETLKVNKFSELSAATALFRPGALHSGQTATFSNRKLGKEEAKPFHPSLQKITEETLGIICYQEQIMVIMNQIGGLSWATSEMSRKIMTKSKGKDAMNKIRAEFVQGAQRIHGIEVSEAEKLFDVVSTFGSYSFNKSHSYGYSIISYLCAWLKTYHKQAFFAACLKHEKQQLEQQRLLQNAKNHNIVVEYPDINKSVISYSVSDGNILAGFDSIEGVGEKVSNKIIKSQPYSSFEDFQTRTKVSTKVLKALIVADCFRSSGINKKVCYNAVGSKKSFNPCDNLSPDFADTEWARLIGKETRLRPQLNICSTYDFGTFKDPFVNVSELSIEHKGKQILVRGIVSDKLTKDKLIRQDLNQHVHHFEQHLIYLNLQDDTGNIAAVVAPHTYEKYSALLQDIKQEAVVLMCTAGGDGKKLFADMMQKANEDGDITQFYEVQKKIEVPNVALLASASPAVSKNKKSYYRVRLSNGLSGLCFSFGEKLFPGMMVKFHQSKEPFINLEVIR